MKFKYLKIGDKKEKDLKAPELYYYNSKGRKILYNAKYDIHFFITPLLSPTKGQSTKCFLYSESE